MAHRRLSLHAISYTQWAFRPTCSRRLDVHGGRAAATNGCTAHALGTPVKERGRFGADLALWLAVMATTGRAL